MLTKNFAKFLPQASRIITSNVSPLALQYSQRQLHASVSKTEKQDPAVIKAPRKIRPQINPVDYAARRAMHTAAKENNTSPNISELSEKDISDLKSYFYRVSAIAQYIENLTSKTSGRISNRTPGADILLAPRPYGHAIPKDGQVHLEYYDNKPSRLITPLGAFRLDVPISNPDHKESITQQLQKKIGLVELVAKHKTVTPPSGYFGPLYGIERDLDGNYFTPPKLLSEGILKLDGRALDELWQKVKSDLRVPSTSLDNASATRAVISNILAK